MRFGMAQAEITPPAGTRFGGFWLERPEPASGAHDPLMVSALVAEGEGGGAAVISCDLQLISPVAVADARHRISTATGIPTQAILIHATHNHGAPGGDWAEAFIEGAGDYFAEPETSVRIVDGIFRAATAAWSHRAEGELLAASGTVAGIGRSRTDPEWPEAAPAALLVVRDPNGGPVRSVLAWYGCHPSIMGPDNRLFTADFPGVVRRQLTGAFPGATALFLGGPAGDISTRNTRREQTFTEVKRLGGELAEQLLALAAGLRPLTGEAVAGRISAVPLELAPLPDSVPHHYRERQQRLARVPVRCPVQAIRLGQLAVVGVGAELYLEPGIQLSRRSPFQLTLVSAPANGSVGNLPSRLFGQGSTGVVIQAAVRLLNQLHDVNG